MSFWQCGYAYSILFLSNTIRVGFAIGLLYAVLVTSAHVVIHLWFFNPIAVFVHMHLEFLVFFKIKSNVLLVDPSLQEQLFSIYCICFKILQASKS